MPLIVFCHQFVNCLKLSVPKQILKYLSCTALKPESFLLCRTLVTHLLNIQHARLKLSTQCHTFIGRTLSAFPDLAGGFAACIQGQLDGMCWDEWTSFSAGGPSASFRSCFHAEALAPTRWLDQSYACACSHPSLTLCLTHRLAPCLHLSSGSSLWTCWELPRL